MSYDAMAWARTVITGSPSRKAVLMNLANRFNDTEGASWPSQRLIAEETEFSERTVRQAMADLEEMNIIRRIKRHDTTDLVFFPLMPKPGRPARLAGASRKPEQSQGNVEDDRQELPVVSDNDNDRQELPEGPAGASGEYRQQSPEAPAAASGGHRQELPTNRYLEPIGKQKTETKVKRGPAAPFPADAFDQFWKLYPNKDAKPVARKSFERIADAGNVEFDAIMEGLRFYVNKDDFREWAMPSTWLNQERWESRPKQKKRGEPSGRWKRVVAI